MRSVITVNALDVLFLPAFNPPAFKFDYIWRLFPVLNLFSTFRSVEQG